MTGVVGAACGGAAPRPNTELCTGENADPNACLAVAEDALARKDEPAARDYMDKLVTAVNAAPACLRDHDERGCFAAVVALLREHPVGLLAGYDLADDLLTYVPRWTGSEETGPRVQARTVLVGMCTVPGRDPIAQQRACIVLGDLVADERMRRCGFDCDPTNKDALPGWSTADVIDGYAAACKVDHARVPAADYAAFTADVTKLYRVPADANPVCALTSSTKKGASIPDALATVDRVRQELKAKQASADTSAKREAERLAAMEKSKAEALARVAAAQQAEFEKTVLDAIHRSDWAVTFGLLTKHRGSPTGESVATAVNKIFDPFTDWAVGQANGSVAGAYLQLATRLEGAPKNHAIRVSLATLRDRALVEATKTAKGARGAGSSWLRKAVVARIAGPLFPEEQKAAADAYAKLVAATRVSLELQSLAPACASLVRPPVAGGRSVKAKAALECTLEPEKRVTVKEPFTVKQHVVGAEGEQDVEQETTIDVTHRTYKVAVHGVVAIYAGAPRKAVPIEFEEIVDDTDGSDRRTYDAAVAKARDVVMQSTVGALESSTASKAYAAGVAALKVGRKEAAENQLVIHGLLSGGSAELDEVMMGYGINFAELLPQ